MSAATTDQLTIFSPISAIVGGCSGLPAEHGQHPSEKVAAHQLRIDVLLDGQPVEKG
jgi:hypothetical protein